MIYKCRATWANDGVEWNYCTRHIERAIKWLSIYPGATLEVDIEKPEPVEAEKEQQEKE